MEADIMVELHKRAGEHGLMYKAVVGDDDTSAIKHIRENVGEVEKFSDISHIKRSLSNKMQESYKSKKQPYLTPIVQASFLKNFTYAYHQNNSKTDNDMKNALGCIVDHMFGEHDHCGVWCNGKSATYSHSSLPYGKDLRDDELRLYIVSLLQPFIQNPKKLLTSGSSQGNESLNNVVYSKAPKAHNYSLSENFDFRVAAAVCQFNEGREYITQVCDNANLSPRKESKKYIRSLDNKRKYDKIYKMGRKFKRRRIELKTKRNKKQAVHNVREGITYETNCSIENDNELDIHVISEPKMYEAVKADEVDTQEIFFDIETTMLGYDAEIVEIGACYEDGCFQVYMLPDGRMSKKASEVNGIDVVYQGGVKKLMKKGNDVRAVAAPEAFAMFLDWLNSVTGKTKVLIAHNCKRFDMPILLKHIEKFGLTERFSEIVSGFSDSLPIFRSCLNKKSSYSLVNLYSDIVGGTYEAHGASDDSRALMETYRRANIPVQTTLINSTRTTHAFEYTKIVCESRQAVDNMLNCLRKDGKPVVSRNIAKKICDSGLSFVDLKAAYCRNKADGLYLLCSEKVSNRPRVTNRRAVIEKIRSAFSS